MTGPFALARTDVDRSAHERTRPDIIDEIWNDPATRVLLVRTGVVDFTPAGDLIQYTPDAAMRAPGDIPVFLGRDAHGAWAALLIAETDDATLAADAAIDPPEHADEMGPSGTNGVVGHVDASAPSTLAPASGTIPPAAIIAPARAAATSASVTATGATGTPVAGIAVTGSSVIGAAATESRCTTPGVARPSAAVAAGGARRHPTLREVGADLGAAEAAWATIATALGAWHAAAPRCPQCGATTSVAQAGWVRECSACAIEYYPRTDPAVIMRVQDDAGRLLLARASYFPARRFSILAGFVEAGESLEGAVRREVSEEAGICVDTVTYLGSQPWPFPRSLMAGFDAHTTASDIRLDEIELAEARWFTRAELAAAVAAQSLLLPPATSIARALIDDWFGEPLPEPAAGLRW